MMVIINPSLQACARVKQADKCAHVLDDHLHADFTSGTEVLAWRIAEYMLSTVGFLQFIKCGKKNT